MLQLEELEDMASAPQELVCHYCNKTYTISESEIQTLVDEKRVKLN
jgi:redox-regulated HSP33 family molecular chaperone